MPSKDKPKAKRAREMPLTDEQAEKAIQALNNDEDQYTIKGDPDPGASEREFNKALYARRAKEKKLALEKLEQIKKARAEGKTVDMARGGMTSKMSKQKGGNTVIVDPAKKSPKSRMKTSGSGSKMAMMKKGGKIRGAGIAKKGIRKCKMR
mgnify:CR=1 FL=1